MRKQVRVEAAECKGLKGRCGGCCRTDNTGDCKAAFAGTPGYPGYFRTDRRYGRTSRSAPDCKAPNDCLSLCDAQAAAAARPCGNSDACVAEAERQRLLCRASRCGETTNTTTTTPPGGTCEALNCDQHDTFCEDFSCQGDPGVPVCVSVPRQPPTCDDGDACNGYEHLDCRAGCLPGSGEPCVPSTDPCYRSECTSVNNVATCHLQPEPGPACGGTTTTLPEGSCEPLDCDQYDTFCEDVSCQSGPGFAVCVSAPKPLPACDDGDACNGYEYLDCAAGCQPGAGNPCPASDLCNSWQCTSIDNAPSCNSTALPIPNCDDGNACNGAETFDCAAGCQAGGGSPCPASDFCHLWECTSINNSASCNPIPLSTPSCDDGDACNGYETFDCAQGVCLQGPPVFCPPGQHCVSEANSPRCEG
jgi:hypothetical protein